MPQLGTTRAVDICTYDGRILICRDATKQPGLTGRFSGRHLPVRPVPDAASAGPPGSSMTKIWIQLEPQGPVTTPDLFSSSFRGNKWGSSSSSSSLSCSSVGGLSTYYNLPTDCWNILPRSREELPSALLLAPWFLSIGGSPPGFVAAVRRSLQRPDGSRAAGCRCFNEAAAFVEPTDGLNVPTVASSVSHSVTQSVSHSGSQSVGSSGNSGNWDLLRFGIRPKAFSASPKLHSVHSVCVCPTTIIIIG